MTGFGMVRLAVPVLLLAGVWYAFDGGSAWERLRQADAPWLIAAFLTLNLQTVLSALRWRLTASCLGMPMRRTTAIGEYYLTQIVNQTLPGGVLGDAARAVRARHAAGLRRSGQAVVIERLLGQVALLTVLLAGILFAAFLPVQPGGPIWPPWTAAAALAALGLAGLMARMPWPDRVSGWIAPLRASVTSSAAWPAQIALGLAIVACNLGAFAMAARATGTVLSPSAIVTVIPLILFAMLLPITVAGWGWREGAAAALFPLAGATPDAGLAASVTFGLVMLAAALPGALWLIRPPQKARYPDA